MSPWCWMTVTGSAKPAIGPDSKTCSYRGPSGAERAQDSTICTGWPSRSRSAPRTTITSSGARPPSTSMRSPSPTPATTGPRRRDLRTQRGQGFLQRKVGRWRDHQRDRPAAIDTTDLIRADGPLDAHQFPDRYHATQGRTCAKGMACEIRPIPIRAAANKLSLSRPGIGEYRSANTHSGARRV